MGIDTGSSVQFEDFLPLMARKLGVEGLVQELCNGFQLLMDLRTGKIIFQSLKRNATRLGLGELRDDELSEMMREGDLDGDGVLDQMEFCILMVRLSPELMEEESHRMFQDY
jgi:calcium-binding protein KIC and related proteins